jgi:hypothetical protein
MSYTPSRHCFRIHKAKRDSALLSLSDSSDYNNAVTTRSDILNEKLRQNLFFFTNIVGIT